MEKKTLILDIDETLIHSKITTEEPLHPDFKANFIPIEGENYETMKRPYVDQFLDYVQKNWTIAFWTSATEDYALGILENLGIKYWDFLYHRDNCTQGIIYNEEGMPDKQVTFKKLSKLSKRGYNLDKVLVIDDTKEAHTHNYGNLILISRFVGDLNDNQLLKMIDYLELIKKESNFRSLEKRDWLDKI
jgi:Dullard-like phosphatase family protein